MLIADLKRDIAILEFTTLVEIKESLASMEKDLAAKQAGRGEDFKQQIRTLYCSSSISHHMFCLSVPYMTHTIINIIPYQKIILPTEFNL